MFVNKLLFLCIIILLPIIFATPGYGIETTEQPVLEIADSKEYIMENLTYLVEFWQNSEDTNRKEFYERVKELESEISETNNDLQKNYDDLRNNEQSDANKLLTALTTATTGIGGKELAQGVSEQNADKTNEQNMNAYIATFSCSYGNGKIVKFGPDEIELPGGNDSEMIKLRNDYFSLANNLKEIKNVLDLSPGIESSIIFDKADIRLYDNETNVNNKGVYTSFYRANALNNETDKSNIEKEQTESKNRVTAGATLVGTGVVGGIIGNMLINKNSSKDNSSEIIAKRDALKSELHDYIQSEIAHCNEQITEAKSLANKIKTLQLSQDDGDEAELLDFADKIDKLTLLSNDSDIRLFPGHPICK